jgi:alpha-mannosidase
LRHKLSWLKINLGEDRVLTLNFTSSQEKFVCGQFSCKIIGDIHMATPPSSLKQPHIHLICNAHLDPVWLWEWEEGAAEAISTFRMAADLCDEFSAFIFNHNEAILYRWIEEYEPELFSRIQRLVQVGKWHIMGGWFLQPDCNMPSGESFIRQILLGRRFFAEKFGKAPTTAINFDSFGHTRGLVQIMAKCGYDSYIHCRPLPEDISLPRTYLWQGYDGSQVMVVRPWGWYLSGLGVARKKVEDFIEQNPDENPGIVLWGVGNHGGGPSRQDLLDLTELSASSPVQIVHSIPEAYFNEIRAFRDTLPVHTGDLNPWGVGCYSSMARSKQKHRQLENELYAVEKMLSAAWCLRDLPYPQTELAEAQRDLATAEFHDILPGSSIQPVEEMAIRLMDHGLEILSRLKARAFFSLSQGQPKAALGEIPVLVYNPHPYSIDAVVECEFQLADQNWQGGFTLPVAYQGGKPLPTQVEQELCNLNLDWRKRVVFWTTLQPGQMNRYDCRFEQLESRPRPNVKLQDGKLHFANDRLRVDINFTTGLLDQYAVDGKEILNPGACLPLVMVDTPDPWGMTMHAFREVEGAFELLNPQEAGRFAGLHERELEAVRVIEDGKVRTVVEALFGYHDSRLCLRYKLPKYGAEIEVEVIVHWTEKDRMLKLSLPFASEKARYLGQVAYGVAELPKNGDEAVAQKWVAVVSEDSAFTVINDRTYGSDFSNGELRLTLLRSPAYAAHPIGDRPLLPEERYSPRHEQGERTFYFWLQGGEQLERLARIERESLAHNEKPMVLSFFPGGGGQAKEAFLTLSDEVVQISAIKKTEDGEDLVVRLFEPTGQAHKTVVSLPFAQTQHEVELTPFELVTLRINPRLRRWKRITPLEGEA